MQKILYNAGDGYVVNIQLVPFNKKEQQVEGPFKLGKLYLVCRGIQKRLFTLLQNKHACHWQQCGTARLTGNCKNTACPLK
jgi:hypothetical protein